MIENHINKGRGNAITGKTLADHLHCDIRAITLMIEDARRAGVPICATLSGDRRGYYLAETQEDIKAYTDALKGRAIEIFKTRQALLKVIDTLPSFEHSDAAGN